MGQVTSAANAYAGSSQARGASWHAGDQGSCGLEGVLGAAAETYQVAAVADQ